MGAKHIAGPYFHSEHDGSYRIHLVDGELIACCIGNEATARLLAASDNMLDALEAIDGMAGDRSDVQTVARAAIALATGGHS